MVIFVAVLLSLCLSFSGCSFKFTQVSDLLKPPVYSEENEGLREAFEADFSKEAVYKSPISGEYLSAYLTFDIDGDKEKEALVFYADDAYDTTASVAVYGRSEDEWVLTSKTEGDGCDVYSVEFSDFNGDSYPEIIVCWSLFDSKSNKIVSVYSVKKDSCEIVKLTAEKYTVKEFSDVDGDGDTELFLVCLDATSGKQESTAKLLGVSDGRLTLLDKKSLDGNVSGYRSIYSEYDAQDKKMTFLIDAYKSDTQMITEVVVWDSKTASLSVPLLDTETRTNTKSWRSTRLYCSDINGDSKKEIPYQEPFENCEIWSGGTELETVMYTTEWFTVEDGECKTAAKTLVNFEERCLFTIPDSWEGRFAVIMYSDTGKWDFYQINPYTGSRLSYLFSVVFLTAQEWGDGNVRAYESYTLLDKTEGKCLAVTGINTENELRVEFDMLSEAFSYFAQ